jgi:lipopolysaccharide/colanic/teichoic acid biosynthesis glycosyltransferase
VTRSSIQKKGITPIAIGGSLLIAAIGAAQLLGARVYYPHVVVEAVENVRLEFLQEGLANGADCDAAAAAIVDAVRASCPTCRVATQQCRDRLEPRYEKLLSEEPIAMPSSRLPHGVVAYVSDNQGLALAACSESERLTAASPGFRAICHQPNTPRPMPGSSAPQLAGVWQVIFSPPAFLLFGLAFAGFLFVRSAAPHARWGALAHGYFPSRVRTGVVKPVGGNDVLRLRNRMLKRSFDILVTAILLLILAPVFLCAVVFLLLTQGRPIFYVSTRYIGLNRPVRVIKFRTMVRDASSPKHKLKERFMREGYLDIPLSCEVYTPIGRILERLQIVELPQLLNVAIDGMSLVGNRPLPKENVELLAQFPAWEKRFESPGGITGISQVVGKLNLTPAQRLRLESLYSKVYQEGNIIRCDFLIIWHTTAGVLLRNEGITLERAEALLRSCLPRQ